MVSAHCSVVSAVSSYLRDLLKDVYTGSRDMVTMVTMVEVDMEDMQNFLQLVYTGGVSMSEDRRDMFTSLLELLNVSDDIGEKVIYQNGSNGHNIGGGVTLTRVSRSDKTTTNRVTVNKKISVAITPVAPSEPPPPILPLASLTPLVPKTEPLSLAPPPVESLLATLNHQLASATPTPPAPAPVNATNSSISVKNSHIEAAQAAADQATKEWLGSAKVPKVLLN